MRCWLVKHRRMSFPSPVVGPRVGHVHLKVADLARARAFYEGVLGLAPDPGRPGAPITHTMRDPVDTCLSCFSKLFTDEQFHT